MGIKKSLHFKEKIKDIFYKSLKRLKVYWCTHLSTDDDDDDNPPKICDP